MKYMIALSVYHNRNHTSIPCLLSDKRKPLEEHAEKVKANAYKLLDQFMAGTIKLGEIQLMAWRSRDKADAMRNLYPNRLMGCSYETICLEYLHYRCGCKEEFEANMLRHGSDYTFKEDFDCDFPTYSLEMIELI